MQLLTYLAPKSPLKNRVTDRLIGFLTINSIIYVSDGIWSVTPDFLFDVRRELR